MTLTEVLEVTVDSYFCILVDNPKLSTDKKIIYDDYARGETEEDFNRIKKEYGDYEIKYLTSDGSFNTLIIELKERK